MTFEELSVRVAMDAGLSVSQARGVIRVTFDAIKSHVLAGGKVGVPKFGTFKRVNLKGGKRNVGGNVVDVPPRQVIKFKGGEGAKRVVR